MSAVAQEQYPDLGPNTAQLAAGPAGAAVLAEIRAAMPASVHHVLNKLSARSGLADPDLCDANPVGLLVMVWRAVRATGPNPDAVAALRCTLEDMGSTCLQGDTHRLFSLHVALHRSGYTI